MKNILLSILGVGIVFCATIAYLFFARGPEFKSFLINHGMHFTFSINTADSFRYSDTRLKQEFAGYFKDFKVVSYSKNEDEGTLKYVLTKNATTSLDEFIQIKIDTKTLQNQSFADYASNTIAISKASGAYLNSFFKNSNHLVITQFSFDPDSENSTTGSYFTQIFEIVGNGQNLVTYVYVNSVSNMSIDKTTSSEVFQNILRKYVSDEMISEFESYDPNLNQIDSDAQNLPLNTGTSTDASYAQPQPNNGLVFGPTAPENYPDPIKVDWSGFKLKYSYPKQPIPLYEYYKKGESGNNWTELLDVRYWKGEDYTSKNFLDKMKEVIDQQNIYKKNIGAVDINEYNVDNKIHMNIYYIPDFPNKNFEYILEKTYGENGKMVTVMYLYKLPFIDYTLSPNFTQEQIAPELENIKYLTSIVDQKDYLNTFLQYNFKLPFR